MITLRQPTTADDAASAAASGFEQLGGLVSDSLAALQRTFDMLRAKYQVKLPATVAQFEDIWRQLLCAEAPVSRLPELIQIAHNISGNAKTFGFASAGEVAREIELCLEPACAAGRLPDAAEQERVATLLAALKNAAQ